MSSCLSRLLSAVLAHDLLSCADRERMFAQASSLKKRHSGPGSLSGLKSDVEPISSESEDSEGHEDPNEYLEDLPAEVRDAEIEHGVLSQKNDKTRSAENPTEAAKRANRKAQRRDRSEQHVERPSSGQGDAGKMSGRVPLADMAKRISRGRSAGANESAMHIQHDSPFGSNTAQDERKDSASSPAAILKSNSELDRLRRMSSDTIDARQPKSDLPLMRHSPDSSSSRPEQGSSPPAQDVQASSRPDGSARPSEKHSVFQQYRDSLGPIGVLGPRSEQGPSGPRQQSSQRGKEDDHPDSDQSGKVQRRASSRRRISDGSSGSLHRRNSKRGESKEYSGRGNSRDQERSSECSQKSSVTSRRSSALTRRMSEFAERQPSADQRSLSPVRQGMHKREQAV